MTPASAAPSTGSWRAGRLFSTSALLLAARLAGAAAGFLVQLILARFLSAHDLGIYFAATSLAVIAGVIAAHGYPGIATRFVSRYRKPSGAPLLRGFVRHAQRETVVLALIATIVIAGVAFAWPGFSRETRFVVALAALTVPFVAAFRLYGALAGATRSFGLAYLPDVCLKPMILLAALGAIITATRAISLPEVMLSLAIATIVLSSAQYVLLRRRFPVAFDMDAETPASPATRSLVSRWRREAHALLLVAIFAQFFPELTILIATPAMGAAEIGVFGLCLKLAFLIGFFVQVSQSIATPDLADALAKRSGRAGNPRLALQGMAATALTLAALLVCALWGTRLLAVFGPDFASGRTALLILVGAQLVRAVSGPNNAVLTLIGEQRANLILTAASLVVLATSVVILGALYGAGGAALAVLLTTSFWSAASAYILYCRHGIRVDLFAGRFGRAANPGRPALARG